MSLRRGFKADANRLSVRLRRGQGRSPESPIDLDVIASRLGIAIVPLTSLRAACPNGVMQLSVLDPSAFSATTLRVERDTRIIVHNDTHDPHRQRSNLSHELSHILLGHPFTYPIDASGCRNIDREIEEEASWLGPTILVSDEAAVHIVRMGLDTDAACRMYQVSVPLLQMRLNASGARIRMKRAYF